jgi:hypothetical protein
VFLADPAVIAVAVHGRIVLEIDAAGCQGRKLARL